MAQNGSAQTIAISGLQVGGVLDGDLVIAECRSLNGQGYTVEDETVWSWRARKGSLPNPLARWRLPESRKLSLEAR